MSQVYTDLERKRTEVPFVDEVEEFNSLMNKNFKPKLFKIFLLTPVKKYTLK